MTDHSCVEPIEDGRHSPDAPTVGLLLQSDEYRTQVRTAVPTSFSITEIEGDTVSLEEFDLLILEESGSSPGSVPEMTERSNSETSILYLTTDTSTIPTDVWEMIDDVVQPPLVPEALEARIRNTTTRTGDSQTKPDHALVGIDCIPDPTLAVDVEDGHRIVRQANSAFAAEFGFEADVLANANLDELIVPETAAEYTSRLVDRALAGETVERALRRDTVHGRRDFLVRMIEADQCESDLWITYTDVTGKQCREQQIQVLNRVLRHNLRNNMNVILGNVDRLLSGVDDPDAEEAGTAIRQAAASLVGLGDTASTLRQTWDDIDPTAIDLVQVARRVRCDARAENPSADIDVVAPDSCWVSGDSRLVTVLSELVENGLEHAQSNAGVEMRIDPGYEWTEIHVIDQGPGLAPSERAVLNGDTETPLEHGSGLGLWIVNWIVSISGGQLDVTVDGTAGTVVTISLPTADLETKEYRR